MNAAHAAGVPSWKLPTPPGDYCFCSSQLPAIKTTLLVSGVGGVEKLLPSAPANSPQVLSWKLPTLPRVAVSAAHNFQLSKPRCVQDSVTGMSINLARPTRSNRAVKIGLFLAGSYPHPLGIAVSAARNFQLSKPRC